MKLLREGAWGRNLIPNEVPWEIAVVLLITKIMCHALCWTLIVRTRCDTLLSAAPEAFRTPALLAKKK